jgi:starch synthase
MRVLFVASECVPFVKTGGLADVVGALPGALARAGVEATVLLPAYAGLRKLLPRGNGSPLRVLPDLEAAVHRVEADGLDLLLLDAPELFDRPGNPYLGTDGRDWPDNHRRYCALSRAGAAIARDGHGGWRPQLVHLHDWQAGLQPLLMKDGGTSVPSVLTIHNIAFQGVFEAQVVRELDLPRQWFTSDGYEYYGKVNMLKAGLVFADAITTVSPTYAKELLLPEFGMGLEGVLASRRQDLHGILNGIDTRVWNPATDPDIAANYASRSPAAKKVNKALVEERFGLEPAADAPLFCVISRLTEQKGIDLLIAALPHLTALGARLVVLGSGDAALEQALLEASRRFSGRIGVILGYDERLSHLIQAGCDAIVVPSRFEPCGLTQLYGLRYGTIPIVARTGGLADTVIDANHAALSSKCATGFVFDPGSGPSLGDALERACAAYGRKPLWRALVRSAMRQDVGWESSARSYEMLYQSLISEGR